MSGSPDAGSQEDPIQEALDRLRTTGLHGPAAARVFASQERFALPTVDELQDFHIIYLDRGAFPSRQGIVLGLHVDVTLGMRSLQAAISLLSRDATPEAVPAEYVSAIELVASGLMRRGRAREAMALSALLLAAADTAYGENTIVWMTAVRPFVQAAAALHDTDDPQLADLVSRAPSLAAALVSAARETADGEMLSTGLSVAGQYWWRIAQSGADQPPGLLKTARELLAEAASLRRGADRGRTLATLAQLEVELLVQGEMTREDVATTAREALTLVDRRDRPRQWLAARRVLRQVDPAAAEYAPLSAEDLSAIRASHGDQAACDCLAAELLYRRLAARSHEAARLLGTVWPILDLSTVDDAGRQSLLTEAVHCIDEGVVPCEDLTDDQASRAFERTSSFSATQRLMARLHLAVHRSDGNPAASWATREGPPLVSELDSGYPQQVSLLALAEIHEARAREDLTDITFAFRCALLAATLYNELGLSALARSALATGLDRAREWVSERRDFSDRADWLKAHTELQGILDACLREAAMLDAALGDALRDWLLEVGRTTSEAAYGGPLATPLTAIAHSEAFKGAVVSRLLFRPGPLPDIDATRELLTEIEALGEDDALETADVMPTPVDEELQLCAWLHEDELLSGGTVRQRRRNLEARYDDLRTRLAVASRPPWAFGLRELPHELVDEQLDDNTALLDLFLGRDERGNYCTYAMVYFRKTWRRYGARHGLSKIDIRANPVDDASSLRLDGLAPLVASVRYHVQEPSGTRHVSRGGSSVLSVASDHVFAKLAGDFSELTSGGCDHLVICPHGPLAFMPFHLLPVGEGLLADAFTITTILSVGSMLRAPGDDEARAQLPLAIIGSPNGGVPFGLAPEPRITDQARELYSLVAGAVSIGDGDATPSATLGLLARSRFAHIAAHGSGIGSSPAFHCLYLEPAEDRDGRLFAHDVLTADLRGLELVTLCACETAVGRADPAGNVRGLPTALLAAGAGAVVATLWPVSAEAALYFFQQLHTELASHGGRLRAYRAAQVEARQRFPDFADWGAFTYIGRWR